MDQIKLEFDLGGNSNSNDMNPSRIAAAALGLNPNNFPELLTTALANNYNNNQISNLPNLNSNNHTQNLTSQNLTAQILTSQNLTPHNSLLQALPSSNVTTSSVTTSLNTPIFAPAMTHPVARASPTTIRWLLEHFEPAAGVSLPRATMYQHYCLHCEEHNIDPVNAASFGKLVRSVFVGLRTRRLGTRGNSKYHYYGIRMKLESPLQSIILPEPAPVQQSSIARQAAAAAAAAQQHASSVFQNVDFSPENAKLSNIMNNNISNNNSTTNSNTTSNNNYNNFSNNNNISVNTNPSSSASPVHDLMSSPEEPSFATNSSNMDAATAFAEGKSCELPTIPGFSQNTDLESKFKSYAQEFLESIVQLKFNELSDIMMSFYSNHVELGENQETKDWLARAENTLYQTIISVLFPSVISPMPGNMNDTLRSFAKTIQETMTNVLMSLTEPIDEDLKKLVTDRASAFSQLIRRITLLNHLSLSIHTIFRGAEEQRIAVVQDLNKINIIKICRESWIEEEATVDDIVMIWQEIKQAMEVSGVSAGQIINTWKISVEKLYSKYRTQKDFIFKWNFLSSMVVRDLTLRSVTSFGSILVLRLFLDELVQYVVLESEAKENDSQLITVKL